MAQDPQFSQFYATPMYLNPAFTGNTLQGRVAGIYRNQWPAIPKAFISYAFSYDHNLPEINSGLGVIAIHDKAGTGGLKYTSIGGLYSYHVQVSRKVVLRPGFRASYVSRFLDLEALTFSDELARGGGFSTTERDIMQKVNYLDLSAGMVVYSNKYWFGFAADHINRPNQSLIQEGEALLPAKYSLHGGYNFPVLKTMKGRARSTMTVTANYKAQQKWDQVDFGMYYTQEPLIVGVWYRGIPLIKSYEPGYANNDAVTFMAGAKMKDVRVAYSYDLTISRLASNTAGSHEVSIIWEYITKQKRRDRRRQRFLVPCAKF